jgi:hypothetical protein
MPRRPSPRSSACSRMRTCPCRSAPDPKVAHDGHTVHRRGADRVVARGGLRVLQMASQLGGRPTERGLRPPLARILCPLMAFALGAAHTHSLCPRRAASLAVTISGCRLHQVCRPQDAGRRSSLRGHDRDSPRRPRLWTPLYDRPFKCKAWWQSVSQLCSPSRATPSSRRSSAHSLCRRNRLGCRRRTRRRIRTGASFEPAARRSKCARHNCAGSPARPQRRGSTFRPGNSPPLMSTFSLPACSASRRVPRDGRPIAPHRAQR